MEAYFPLGEFFVGWKPLFCCHWTTIVELVIELVLFMAGVLNRRPEGCDLAHLRVPILQTICLLAIEACALILTLPNGNSCLQQLTVTCFDNWWWYHFGFVASAVSYWCHYFPCICPCLASRHVQLRATQPGKSHRSCGIGLLAIFRQQKHKGHYQITFAVFYSFYRNCASEGFRSCLYVFTPAFCKNINMRLCFVRSGWLATRCGKLQRSTINTQ